MTQRCLRRRQRRHLAGTARSPGSGRSCSTEPMTSAHLAATRRFGIQKSAGRQIEAIPPYGPDWRPSDRQRPRYGFSKGCRRLTRFRMSRTVLCSRASKPYPLFPKTCSKPDVHRRTESGAQRQIGAQLHLILCESDVGALMRQHASPIGVAASSRSAEDYGPTSVQVGFPRGDSGRGAAYM